MSEDGERATCRNCGKEIEYHAGSKGWFHLPFMTYYCKVRPNVYSQDPKEFNRAEVSQ